MTTEEIEDNYEFKVTKRILKKEFPFIKDMTLTHDWDNYQSQYFVDLDMDLTEVFNTLNIPIDSNVIKYANKFTNGYPYLDVYFPIKYHGMASDLAKRVTNTIRRVQNSPSMPPDMKLGRDITISGWMPIGQVDIPKQSYPQDNVDK